LDYSALYIEGRVKSQKYKGANKLSILNQNEEAQNTSNSFVKEEFLESVSIKLKKMKTQLERTC
jgi:hypothetical protein